MIYVSLLIVFCHENMAAEIKFALKFYLIIPLSFLSLFCAAFIWGKLLYCIQFFPLSHSTGCRGKKLYHNEIIYFWVTWTEIDSCKISRIRLSLGNKFPFLKSLTIVFYMIAIQNKSVNTKENSPVEGFCYYWYYVAETHFKRNELNMKNLNKSVITTNV